MRQAPREQSVAKPETPYNFVTKSSEATSLNEYSKILSRGSNIKEVWVFAEPESFKPSYKWNGHCNVKMT